MISLWIIVAILAIVAVEVIGLVIWRLVRRARMNDQHG